MSPLPPPSTATSTPPRHHQAPTQPTPSTQTQTHAHGTSSPDPVVTPSQQPNDLDGPSSFLSTASSQQSDDHDTSATTPAEKHPRAKRKRTGAHDKMILEDAYRANSKPDKQARLDLVSRVSLSEKEVQVWFQNRRQNDRRKSRPLTSEELANLHHSGIRLVSAAKDPADHESVLKVTSGPVPIAVPDPIRRPGMPMSVSFDGRYQPQHHHQHGHSRSLSSEEANHHAALPHQQPFPPSSQDSTHPGLSSSFPGTLGYIANRRRESGAHAFSTPASRPAHHLDSSFTFRSSPTGPPSHCSTPQSQMRLSCSIDGKAELIPDISTPPATVSSAAVGERSSPTSGSTPCHPSRPREFRRSYSATTAATASMNAAANGSGSSSTRLPSISTLLNPAAGSSSPTAPSPLPRGPSGRSRNVEAWESCAASQTRDELTAMAEKESNGDAAARISLIRSASGSHHHANALQPSSGTKRNDAPRRHAPAAKRAKFSRATSSLARLEGAATAANPDPKKPDGDDVWLSPTADSDKENWSPVNEARQSQLPTGAGSVPRKQSVPPVAPLQDASSRRANSNLARAGRMRLAKDAAKGGIAIFDEAAARPGEDVERFMRGSVSPSKKGDLEVVSSLLSLSKGAWE